MSNFAIPVGCHSLLQGSSKLLQSISGPSPQGTLGTKVEYEFKEVLSPERELGYLYTDCHYHSDERRALILGHFLPTHA